MDTTAHTTPANRGQLSRQEMDTKMDNEEITPRPIGHASEILFDEIDRQPVNAHTINEWAQWLRTEATREQVADVLVYFRRLHANTTESLNQHKKGAERWRTTAESIRETLADDREHLARVWRILEEYRSHNGLETIPAPPEDDRWTQWLGVAYGVGILTGHASEAHRLAEELRHEFPQAVEVWDRISAYWRTPDATYPQPVDVGDAVRTALMQSPNRPTGHALDPALAEGWRQIWLTAKRHDMCEVFDTLATALGVPRYEFTKSGYVDVSFYGRVSVPVEGVRPGDDIEEYIDLDDIVANLTSYEITVDGIDTSDLGLDDE